MSDLVHDPVIGYRVGFERQGDDLVINTWADPGGGPPPHVHPNGDEIFTIEKGQVEFLVGRKKVVANPGDELVVPAGTRHGFTNIGAEEAVFKAVVRPERSKLGGEGFFRETAAAAQKGMYTKRGVPKGFRAAMHLMGILERYQDFVLISNPPPAVQRLLFPLSRRFGD
jgi:mannose-6-phosphate isomerase-like protein (cupin superfamily)